MLGILSLLPALLGGLFHSCIETGPLKQSQARPSWVSLQTDRLWSSVARSLTEEVIDRRYQLKKRIQSELRQLPESPSLIDSDEGEIQTRAVYGKLPEVRVDLGQGAIFPVPIAKPERFSWYQSALLARQVLKRLRKLEKAIDQWERAPREKRLAQVEHLNNGWRELSGDFAKLSQYVRYLETWVPQLSRQWVAEGKLGRSPANFQITEAIQRGDPEELSEMREALRPKRVAIRSFLPTRLDGAPGGLIVIPVYTDIEDKRFLDEIEGALDTHWNHSPWARKGQVSFHIRWRKLPRNVSFANGKTGLSEHLVWLGSKVPEDAVAMTTGGLTTYVKGGVLVFGPGKLTPRTLAHEIGHLIGFGDCYLRTISGQGMFGTAVLEWDNPFFPDDLMCDNTVGVSRAEVW